MEFFATNKNKVYVEKLMVRLTFRRIYCLTTDALLMRSQCQTNNE